MATNTLTEIIKTVDPGEDAGQAFQRLYGSQTKPCDFRRWFTTVQRDKSCVEIDEDLNARIRQYIEEGMPVEEAFLEHCPDYVGPGEFAVAFDRELRSRRVEESSVA